MDESSQQGQDRSSSASIPTLPLHHGDGPSAEKRIEKPNNETFVSLNHSIDAANQSEAWNASRSHTPINSSNTYIAPVQTYYYGGYDDGLINWGEGSNYVHTNNLQIMSPAIYNDNSSLLYHPAFTYDTQIAYAQFPQIASQLSPIMIDGQLYSPHQLPISPSYYSQPISPTDYYLQYPRNNNLGFYKFPNEITQCEPVSTQSNPVGILGPYHGSYEATRVDKNMDRVDSVSLSATTSDRNRGPRALKPKGTTTGEHMSNEDFVTSYEKAKFFVIKSFSEDNVHRSIKYGVWASTPLGNRKLDAAFKEAKEYASRVFLFFSVNASGQFCGVAEMIGGVDFEKDADYWQQDRWSGQFRVKWHIIKDVPNSRFRHILLENNDNKPVTHSRDSQEVKLEEGNTMLKIFKEHDADTSILDDFNFYDEREKSLQEKRTKEQVFSTKNTIDDASINRLSDRVANSLQLENQNEVTKS
ncbi:uncharacterized protein LOC111887664 [Lactuca sativa]|uniref:uncharacterized protein LOC111887664 n=1 Tax=Lactuca sativa TaxID=4236 RepID=UPI000CD8DE75|nr:uncharacterized protein LOC111887664 [Lactuca sativa]